MKIDFLEQRCVKYEPVGSRVTCNPPPTDTDQDVLVLANPEYWAAYLEPLLVGAGFDKGGSDCGDSSGYMATTPLSFQSYTLEELNLIVTFDPEFYRRFMAATGVAKHLNLMDKADRVLLFQAVLYGNPPPPPFEEFAFSMPPVVETVQAFWVCFEGKGSKCVEALNADAAKTIGGRLMGAKALSCEKLPYPADPRLNPYQHPDHGVFPSFCHSPGQCRGRSPCPQRYSCTE